MVFEIDLVEGDILSVSRGLHLEVRAAHMQAGKVNSDAAPFRPNRKSAPIRQKGRKEERKKERKNARGGPGCPQ